MVGRVLDDLGSVSTLTLCGRCVLRLLENCWVRLTTGTGPTLGSRLVELIGFLRLEYSSVKTDLRSNLHQP